MIVALTVSAVGCSAPEEQPTAVPTARAEVDATSRTIVLPSERFWLTQDELETVESAFRLAQNACLEEHGIFGQFPKRRVIPEISGDRRYGVWVMADAEQWGYVPPFSSAKNEAMTATGPPRLTDEQVAIAQKCAQTQDVAALRMDQILGPWQQELADASARAHESSAWADVLATYHRCLRDEGLTPTDTDPLSVVGVDTAAVQANIVKPEDIEKAVKDVTCKDRVRLVQHLADLEAQAQEPVVQRYLNELQAQRAKVDTMLERAREVLREQGL